MSKNRVCAFLKGKKRVILFIAFWGSFSVKGTELAGTELRAMNSGDMVVRDGLLSLRPMLAMIIRNGQVAGYVHTSLNLTPISGADATKVQAKMFHARDEAILFLMGLFERSWMSAGYISTEMMQNYLSQIFMKHMKGLISKVELKHWDVNIYKASSKNSLHYLLPKDSSKERIF